MISKYTNILTNSYSLAHLIFALENCNIHRYAIVLEDNDLYVRIPIEVLDKIVYPKNLKENNVIKKELEK